jgi:hypothetical protein
MQINLNLYPFNFPAQKVRTVDGDTLIVDIDLGFNTFLKNRNLRVEGLDTPETRTKDALEKEAGLLVSKWVAAVTPLNLTVLSKKLDKYGRILGNLIWPVTLYALDDTSWTAMKSDIISQAAADGPYMSLSYLLISSGMARPYDGGTRKRWTKTRLREIIQIVKKDFRDSGYHA